MAAHLSHIFRHIPQIGNVVYAWWAAMHSRIDFVALVDDKPEPLAIDIASRMAEEIRAIESAANRFNPDSELSRARAAAAEKPTVISNRLAEILDFAIKSHARSLGFFDITVGSLNHSADTINSVELSLDNSTLFLNQSDVCLDLSGMLKGYALEAIRPILSDAGIDHALVNFGNSSVMAIGNAPSADGWNVAFADSDGSGISLHDECLTTSGNNSPGRRHIVNPTTGSMVEGVGQVAVVTPDAASGEVLSTALFAAGTDTAIQQAIAANFAHSRIISQ